MISWRILPQDSIWYSKSKLYNVSYSFFSTNWIEVKCNGLSIAWDKKKHVKSPNI